MDDFSSGTLKQVWFTVLFCCVAQSALEDRQHERKQFNAHRIKDRHFLCDDKITAVVVAQAGGERVVYVLLRSICDYLGLDWSGQRQRKNRDPVLADVVSGVGVTPTPLGDNPFANPQEMLCISLDYLNGRLFSVNANRVKYDYDLVISRHSQKSNHMESERRNSISRRYFGV